jgi:hypothetical protein
MSQWDNKKSCLTTSMAIISLIVAIVVLVFGDNFFQQITGRSFFSSLREHHITIEYRIPVPANVYWIKTGILIDAGQHLTMLSTGAANTWAGNSQGSNDPNGNLNPLNCEEDTCVLKNVKYGALVGKIGDDNPFVIGDYTEMVAVTSGELQLVVNDKEDYYFDNFGELKVTLYVWH